MQKKFYILIAACFLYFSCGEKADEVSSSDYQCNLDDKSCKLGSSGSDNNVEQSDDNNSKENSNSDSSPASTNSNISINSCKSKQYLNDAISELALSNQNWCGDLSNRFSKTNGGDPNDYIYDSYLKGYWSKQNTTPVKYSDAKMVCGELGSDWTVPTVYQLLSLQSESFASKPGQIHELFDDNDSRAYLSSTKAPKEVGDFSYPSYQVHESPVWIVDFIDGRLGYNGFMFVRVDDKKICSHCRVRCFRAN